jgi:hypothetical protein
MSTKTSERVKLEARTLVKGSFATFRTRTKGQHFTECDLEKLCEVLINWGDCPTNITYTRAVELALLAESWMKMNRAPRRKK